MKKLLLTAAALALTIHQTLAAPMCLTREYDNAHLAKHPQQTITAMTLLLDEHAYFTVAFSLRGTSNLYLQTGFCPDGGTTCYVECDGGGLSVSPTRGGWLAHFDRMTTAVYRRGGSIGCADAVDTGQTAEIEGGPDNSPVKLYERPFSACAYLVPLREELIQNAVNAVKN